MDAAKVLQRALALTISAFPSVMLYVVGAILEGIVTRCFINHAGTWIVVFRRCYVCF